MDQQEEGRVWSHETPPVGAVSLWIPGRPIAFARTATVTSEAKFRQVTPARYAAWRADAVGAISVQRIGRESRAPLTGEVAAVVLVYPNGIEVTATEPVEWGEHRRPKGVTGDLDNYVKAVLDTLQTARVVENDRQVTTIFAGFMAHPSERTL